MKKFFILFGLLVCFGTSAFARVQDADELTLTVGFPLNQLDEKNWINGVGGTVNYKTMLNGIWGFDYSGSLIFPTKGSELYNKYLTVDVSVGIALRLFDNSSLEFFLIPSVGMKYLTNSIFTNTSDDHEVSYVWFGICTDMNYKLSSFLYLTAGLDFEYNFYGIKDNSTSAVNFLNIIPKAGITLLM